MRDALGQPKMSIAQAAAFLARPDALDAAEWPKMLDSLSRTAKKERGPDDEKLARGAAALLALKHCGDSRFCAAFLKHGGLDALGRLEGAFPEEGVIEDVRRAREKLQAAPADDAVPVADGAAATDARRDWRAAEARLGAATCTAAGPDAQLDAAPATPPPLVAAVRVSLRELVVAAGLGEDVEATLAAERVGPVDLVDALTAGDLNELLKECGLKAGDRTRLARYVKTLVN